MHEEECRRPCLNEVYRRANSALQSLIELAMSGRVLFGTQSIDHGAHGCTIHGIERQQSYSVIVARALHVAAQECIAKVLAAKCS